MSLYIFKHPSQVSRPSRILNQRFGLDLEPDDLFSPMISPNFFNSLGVCPSGGYLRHWNSLQSQNDSGSTINLSKDKFEANLDIQQFKPEEVNVKVLGNIVTVEGKHEEREDKHGYISRSFIRKYVVPKGHDLQRIESKLSSDGILTITAPKTTEDDEMQRVIPIAETGQPALSGKKQGTDQVKDH